MTIEALHEGLGILMAHGATGHNVSAQHDEVFVGDFDKVKGLKLSDHRKLKKLRFHLDKENRCWHFFT